MTESIGSTLKQRREARHLSIEQVAEQTRVRMHYLQALENDDLSAIPSMVQARGFLRIYAEFLGLNLDALSSAPRSNESQSITSPVAATAEPLPAPIHSNIPASDSQPRLSLFGGLRNRFARRPSSEAVAPEPEASVPSEPEPKPEEVFVPVRTHEELPAAPEEVSVPEQIALPEPIVKPARVRKPSTRKASNKKPVRSKAKTKTAKATKSSKASTGKKTPVKKKMTKLPSRKISRSKKKTSLKKPPRLKRASSPRKSSSSRPHRRLMKPNRKSVKPSSRTKSRKTKRSLPKKSRK
ncbi:MAG: helix-turn-helix transcriptional regulator [Anaerolineales bacterium]